MATQNYANHRQTVPMYHVVLFGVLVLTLIGSVVNLVRSFDNREVLYSASLITALTAATLVLFFYTRIFALKAQDRAIRAEENLRHYVLTGSLLDPRLTIRQVVALRFASDEEFPKLAARAAEENVAPDVIKQAIEKWRPDTWRV